MNIKNILHRPWVWIIALSVLINVATWLIAIYIFPREEAAAVLHYNTSVGIDFIGESNQINAIPMIGSILLVGNLLLSSFLYRASTRAANIFWSVLPIIEATLLAALLLILRLNQ